MADSVAGVVLAAGAGTRLAPLTRVRPKALCPVGTVPLIDHALGRVSPLVGEVAVNLHHGVDAIDAHLRAEVHRSIEQPVALGTAGALGALRSWLDGRDALVTNVDGWYGADLDLTSFVEDWDRERTRLLCVSDTARGDFGDLRYCGMALIPAAALARLRAEPSGLYEVQWRAEAAAGRLDLVTTEVPFIDCGTAVDYLAANMAVSGGRSVIDPAAVVESGATIERSVIWDGAEVGATEVLVDAIRAPGCTVLVRSSTR